MSIQREAIGKKLRFEVFKRDKFACQYCGKVAPNVVLEVDHINPVSKGGNNEILNLITSCYDCNRGKTNHTLDDDSVISKQRAQLELLQERREQIELMFQWKEGLNKIKDDSVEMLESYINNKIGDRKLNETGLKIIKDLLKRFEIKDILEAVDISEKNYLKLNNDGKFDQVSVSNFINKIGGILTNQNRSELDNKKSYICGICRNRFGYWDNRKGFALLNGTIKILRENNLSEEKILEILDQEITPRSKTAKNWTVWREMLLEIENKYTTPQNQIPPEEDTEEVNNATGDNNYTSIQGAIERSAIKLCHNEKKVFLAVCHIASAFESFNYEDFQIGYENFIIELLHELIKEPKNLRGEDDYYINMSLYCSNFTKIFLEEIDKDEVEPNEKTGVKLYLYRAIVNLIEKMIMRLEIFDYDKLSSHEFKQFCDRYVSLKSWEE